VFVAEQQGRREAGAAAALGAVHPQAADGAAPHLRGGEELQAILRLDMSRHCVREFQKHFKIYADVFCTVGDTLDGVTAVFDQHREHIDGLNADAEELRAAIRQLEAQLVAQQRKHDEEMNASVIAAGPIGGGGRGPESTQRAV
jgi:hypothetical protein